MREEFVNPLSSTSHAGTLCAPAISPAAYVKARHSRGQGILLLLIAFTVLVIIFVCGAICIFQLCPLCSGICNLQVSTSLPLTCPEPYYLQTETYCDSSRSGAFLIGPGRSDLM